MVQNMAVTTKNIALESFILQFFKGILMSESMRYRERFFLGITVMKMQASNIVFFATHARNLGDKLHQVFFSAFVRLSVIAPTFLLFQQCLFFVFMSPSLTFAGATGMFSIVFSVGSLTVGECTDCFC